MSQLQNRTTDLYKGLDRFFDFLEQGSEYVPGVGEGLSSYFKYLGDYLRKNLAPGLKYDYNQRAEDIQRQYLKDLKHGTFEVENIPRNPDGTYYNYGGSGSLGPRKLSDIQRFANIKSIEQKEHAMGKIMPVIRNIEKQVHAMERLRPSQPLMSKMAIDYAPMLPLYIPPQSFDTFWNPQAVSREPIIYVNKEPRKHENLNFQSNQNENPNAAFATTGFSKRRPRNTREKLYKVVI